MKWLSYIVFAFLFSTPVFAEGIQDMASAGPKKYPEPVGLDLTINSSGGSGNCSGTLVARKVVDKSECRNPLAEGEECCGGAIATAAHCFSGRVRTVSVDLPGQSDVGILNLPDRLKLSMDLENGRDAAVMKFTASCKWFGDLQPARIAQVLPDGRTDVKAGAQIAFKKRKESITDFDPFSRRRFDLNPGGGQWIETNLSPRATSQGKWSSGTISSKVGKVIGGDSGGPIRNSATNEWIGNTSSTNGSVVFPNGNRINAGNEFHFDAKAAQFVRGHLANWGFDPNGGTLIEERVAENAEPKSSGHAERQQQAPATRPEAVKPKTVLPSGDVSKRPTISLQSLLKDREYSLMTYDRANREIEHWRDLLKDDPQSLRRKMVQKIFALDLEQRAIFAERLIDVGISKESPDPNADKAIRHLLRDFVGQLTAGGEMLPPWKALVEEITTKNEKWNDTLREVVDADGKVHRDKKVTVTKADGTPEEITGQEWIDRQIKNIGFDALVRWAVAKGGDAGDRTLAMLGIENEGKLQLGVRLGKPDEKLPFQIGDKTEDLQGAGTLQFAPSAHDGLSAQLRRALPETNSGWDQIEFQKRSEAHGTKILDFAPVPAPQVPRSQQQQPQQPIPSQPEPVQPQVPSLSPEQRAQAQRAIQAYEGLRYEAGDRSVREHFPPDLFRDVPREGTGKIILAYFGPRRLDLEQAVKSQPFMEVRNYPMGSPEQRRNPGTQAVGIDGIGRKMTRYAMDPMDALRGIIQSGEPQLLQRYLQAKNGLSAQTPKQSPAQSARPSQPAQPVQPQTPNAPQVNPGTPRTPARSQANRQVTPASGAHFSGMVGSRCNSCHDNRPNLPKFPSYVTNWDEWEEKLKNNDPGAKALLHKFYEQTVESNSMLVNGKGKGMTDEESQVFSSFIKNAHETYYDAQSKTERRTEAVPSSGAVLQAQPNSQAIKLIRDDFGPGYYSALASVKTTDPALNKILKGFDIIYDKNEVLDAHQFPFDGTTEGVGARPLKFSRNPGPPAPYILNGDRTWKAPFNGGFGTDQNDPTTGRFFLMSLPRDAQGNPRKIVNYKSSQGPNPLGPSAPVEHSIYPAGTQFAEVLFKNVTLPNGSTKTFIYEIRTREKQTTPAGDGKLVSQWTPNVYRPYATYEEFTAEVQKHASEAGANSEYAKLSQWVAKNTGTDTVRSDMGKLLRNERGQRVDVNQGRVTKLPNDLSAQAQVDLFTDRPLQPVRGNEPWALSGGPFPKGFHGGAVPVTTENCTGCHAHSNERISEAMPSTRQFTAQYGRFMGSDGVLSFHRWDPNALKRFESVGPGSPNRDVRVLRSELKNLYEDFSASRHDKAIYTPFAQ